MAVQNFLRRDLLNQADATGGIGPVKWICLPEEITIRSSHNIRLDWLVSFPSLLKIVASHHALETLSCFLACTKMQKAVVWVVRVYAVDILIFQNFLRTWAPRATYFIALGVYKNIMPAIIQARVRTAPGFFSTAWDFKSTKNFAREIITLVGMNPAQIKMLIRKLWGQLEKRRIHYLTAPKN